MERDEYEELAKELVGQVGIDLDIALEIVTHLQTEDLLDQAVLYNRFIEEE